MNAKKKGNAGENKFANWLQGHGFKAYKNGSSGGNHNKSDIHNSLDINFEVKTCKKINLKKCWYQTNRDASMAKSMPMLAVHFDGMPEEEWLMVMSSSDWIEMFKDSKKQEITGQPLKLQTNSNLISEQRELAYVLNTAKVAMAKAIKLLEGR